MPPSSHQHPTRRTGIAMLMISFALGLGVLTLFFDGILQTRENPNASPASEHAPDGSVRVVLARNAQGHYVVSGTIDGTAARFLLDTGATEVVVPEALARRAGLSSLYPSRALTANGEVLVYATSIRSLRIGDIVLTDVDASINPAMQGDTVLLGMSALRQIEFTQRGDTLTLHSLP